MKIEKRGVTITEVPGLESIDVAPASEDSYPGGVCISLVFEKRVAFTRTDLVLMIQGLTAALEAADGMTHPTYDGTYDGKRWTDIFTIPADVDRVLDAEEDWWIRDSMGHWRTENVDGAGGFVYAGPATSQYGPFRKIG